MNPPDLRSRGVRGAAWALGLRYSMLAIGLARTAVLARLLDPTAYGLFAIGLLVINISEVATRAGFTHSIVRSARVDRDAVSTLWTADVLRGISVTLLLVLLAPLAARALASPEATSILRVLALSLIHI